MRSEEDANRAVDLYGDTVRRICMIHLKNMTDTEDIFQTVFLKYVLHTAPFDSPEHEKAWIIRVTVNACKDLLKSFFHTRTVSLDALTETSQEIPEDYSEVLEAVLALPENTKIRSTSIIMRDTQQKRSDGSCTKTQTRFTHF